MLLSALQESLLVCSNGLQCNRSGHNASKHDVLSAGAVHAVAYCLSGLAASMSVVGWHAAGQCARRHKESAGACATTCPGMFLHVLHASYCVCLHQILCANLVI